VPHIQGLHGIRISPYGLEASQSDIYSEARELDYTEAKAYHPISLSSFVLKTMEKLVDRHVRDGVLRIHPLNRNQHAYQKGKSTETALRNVVTRIEYAIEHKDIALGAFLDRIPLIGPVLTQ
jgi:hypothetical protein